MPIKNNRNSRDDKSKKVDRSAKSSKDFASKNPGTKPERTDALNIRPRKLFGEGGDTPLKGGFKKTDSKPERKGRDFEKPSDNLKDRKFSKPDNKFSKPDDRKSGRTDDRKFSKPSDDRKFSKSGDKPFSRPDDRKLSKSGDKPFSRPDDRKFSKSADKPFTRSDDNKFSKPDDRKFTRPDDRRGADKGARKVWNKSSDDIRGERAPSSYGRPDTGKPYKKEYKPKTQSSDERKWTSDERVDRKPGGKGKKTPVEKFTDGLIRLNRYIANAGICSRRKADELIEAGVVSVNGEVVSELGTKVDPTKDIIRYNGETLKREKMVYVLLNKPKDYITTTDDPQERRTVMHLVEKASRERIYPVGRLDRNTTGLLLMTNDGALAEKLSHPRNSITKIYQVELNKNLSQGDLNKIGFGIELEDGLIKPDAVSYVQGGSKNEIGIQIHSGKNRVVRRIFEHLGYEVVKLDRVVYGNLTKKDLTRGRWRYLEEKEIIQLKHLIS
ncbi:MAG TPA: pseudouridylate synthase [Sphingobacteriaceae bacterium]|nr:pseudouridylate synthase [Sphingobacteriaceae bacterium]